LVGGSVSTKTLGHKSVVIMGLQSHFDQNSSCPISNSVPQLGRKLMEEKGRRVCQRCVYTHFQYYMNAFGGFFRQQRPRTYALRLSIRNTEVLMTIWQ